MCSWLIKSHQQIFAFLLTPHPLLVTKTIPSNYLHPSDYCKQSRLYSEFKCRFQILKYIYCTYAFLLYLYPNTSSFSRRLIMKIIQENNFFDIVDNKQYTGFKQALTAFHWFWFVWNLNLWGKAAQKLTYNFWN